MSNESDDLRPRTGAKPYVVLHRPGESAERISLGALRLRFATAAIALLLASFALGLGARVVLGGMDLPLVDSSPSEEGAGS